MSMLVCLLGYPIAVGAGPREDFLQSELKFVDFQNPDPNLVLSSDIRSRIKERFSFGYNRSLAAIIRLDYESGRIERAINMRELSGDVEQLQMKLAYARTRLAEARLGLDGVRGDFERLLVPDLQTTPRTRMARIRGRFEREVAAPTRNAHMVLIGIALKLKETQ